MCFARLQPVLWQGRHCRQDIHREMCVVPKNGVTRLNLFRQLDRVSQHIQMFGSSMKFAVSPQGSTWQLLETCPTHKLLVQTNGEAMQRRARRSLSFFHTGVVNDVSRVIGFAQKFLCCVTIVVVFHRKTW